METLPFYQKVNLFMADLLLLYAERIAPAWQPERVPGILRQEIFPVWMLQKDTSSQTASSLLS